MVSKKKYAATTVKLLTPGILGALAVVLRYGMKTPQPLKSALPGEDRVYKWTQGHIFYKVFGAEDAPPLVLFHSPGIGATAYEMRHIVDGLSKNYRVYAPDLLGFGLSDHPRIAYSAQTYIALLEDFLTHVVQRPAVVLASGLSCNYAVAAAQRIPALCARLVLLSPSPLYNHVHYSTLRRYSIQHTPLGFLFYALLTEHWPLRLLLARQHGITAQEITRGEVGYVYAAAHQRGAHYAACSYLAGELDIDVTAQLDTLRQPTLIIWGEQSVQPLPADVPALVSSAASSASSTVQTTTLPTGGTRLQEERPTKVVDRVLSWQETADEQSPIPQATVPTKLPEEETATALPVEVAAPDKERAPEETVVSDSESTPEEMAAPVTGDGELEDAAVGEQASTVEPVEDTETVVQAVLPSEPVLSVQQTIPVKTTEAYCVKCRQKRPMQDAKQIVTKNGRNAMEGLCPICGTRLFRFVAR